MQQAKRIIEYVNGTADHGIWYTKDTSSYLVRYSDADWARNAEDRKTEAEYIAAGSCCTQLLWMKQMLSEYREK
ncbi:unnamed protein product [Rhodiola kirilowii]